MNSKSYFIKTICMPISLFEKWKTKYGKNGDGRIKQLMELDLEGKIDD